jgi:hypothetical protein
VNTPYSVVVGPVLQLLPDEEDPVIVHEQEWVCPQDSEDVMPLNGAVSPREWFIRTPTGETLRPEGDRGLRSPLDYFLLMMPPFQLLEVTRLTNIQLRKSGSQKVATTQGEILRFIGVLLLSTRLNSVAEQVCGPLLEVSTFHQLLSERPEWLEAGLILYGHA